jgi:hypothetical protein
MDVQKTGRWWCEVALWSHRVAVDYGALAGLTGRCPGAEILLHARPYEALRDQPCRCFGARV